MFDQAVILYGKNRFLSLVGLTGLKPTGMTCIGTKVVRYYVNFPTPAHLHKATARWKDELRFCAAVPCVVEVVLH